VTAALADDGPDGWRIYRLEDTRGYTHARDTIRVGRYNAVDGRVERMTRDGWTHLFAVRVDKDGYVDQGEAVRRAVAVLYGMEKHG
jgi:hypothetical protein